MDIAQAKRQVKDTVEAYLAQDEYGEPLLPTTSQRPVFLVGAPGIGKTAIMSQIADELGISLVSYSMTHHTRQSALGLPFIVSREFDGEEYDASEYTMSEIIGSVYDNMRESGNTQGILFLDEINCVSETLYPSMLQFLQFKTFGRHKVPDGWIVVTAGNPPEYNRSVHEFDVVTLDRIKKIEVEPSFDAWKSYALDKGVHPAVLTFLEAKKNRFYSIESTLDGKSFVTARAWDDLSDIIRVYERMEKPVDAGLIGHYVQDTKIAGEFAAYYELFNKYRDDYKIESILGGKIDSDVLDRARAAEFDERLSILSLMLDSLETEHRQIMDRTDVLIAVRDALREIKEYVSSDKASLYECLQETISSREGKLAVFAASSAGAQAKRHRLKEEISILQGFLDCAKRDDIPNNVVGLDMIAQIFAEDFGLGNAPQIAQGHLSAAFDFVMNAFGDQQEMLVFVTELTQRTPSARFIAQFGCQPYYEHNQKMILSDTQRKLRAYVDEIDDVWEI